MELTWIVLAVVAVIVFWLILTYNGLISGRNRVDEAWSDIEVQLKRRYDLIPNLVNTVKGYASHEEGVFTKVTEARTAAMGAKSMKEHAQAKGYQFPYLLDHESLLANAFGGQTTPHVFLFDKNFQLVYKGAIDDNYKEASAVKNHYLKDAIEHLAAGKPIAMSETKPVGCGIKRKLD